MTGVRVVAETTAYLGGWAGTDIAQPGLFWGVENRAATSYLRGGVSHHGLTL